MTLNREAPPRLIVHPCQIATGQMPVRGAIPPPSAEQCPEAVTQIIQECMSRKPEDRPTAKDVFV